MMVSPKQHEVIKSLILDSFDYPGDVVEAGCNAGSTSGLLATIVAGTGRQLCLFDSFEGLPAESGYAGAMAVDRERLELNVRQQLGNAELPSFVRIVEGWFLDTMPARLPDQIAFAFVDCDVYESAIDSLPSIIERLTGTLVVHDYTHERWGAGIRRAISDVGLKVDAVEGMAVWRAGKC